MTTEISSANDAAPNGNSSDQLTSVTVTLDTPIKRGKTTIDCLTIQRPHTGALRGINIMDIAQINVTALQKLLPRITSPALTESEIASLLDVADLTAIGAEVANFLVRKKDRLERL